MSTAGIHGDELTRSLVGPGATVQEAVNHMLHEVALVVDEAGVLIGLVTDGDLRRSLLRHGNLQTPVSEVMTRAPFAVAEGTSREAIRQQMLSSQIRHLPVVDAAGRPVRVELLKDHFAELGAHAVVMAGGKGTRLHPLTIDTPKPLLRVGDQAILDRILHGLRRNGIGDVVLSVNYLREQIRRHVGQGDEYGLHVEYVEEERQLGTAGALALLSPRPTSRFLVMNGDLLTELDFRAFTSFHQSAGNDLTICVRHYATPIPYGVITLDEAGDRVLGILEKPTHHALVNAGIYMLEPPMIDLIPRGESYDMTSLIEKALATGCRVGAFPVLEYWCDIGQPQDMAAAQQHWAAASISPPCQKTA